MQFDEKLLMLKLMELLLAIKVLLVTDTATGLLCLL